MQRHFYVEETQRLKYKIFLVSQSAIPYRV